MSSGSSFDTLFTRGPTGVWVSQWVTFEKEGAEMLEGDGGIVKLAPSQGATDAPDPLMVVDGVVVDRARNLAVRKENIEQVEVMKGGAARAAPEAGIKLLVRAHREGGRFLVVERAAGLVVLAGFLERHPPINDLDDIQTLQQLVDEISWYATLH